MHGWGRSLSGIGQYVVNLVEHLVPAAGDNDEIEASTNLPHRRRFEALGVECWSPAGRLRRDLPLPSADVIHGPNFHAPGHPPAVSVATIHDLGYLTLPGCHPPGMPEALDGLVRASLDRTAIFICVSHATKAEFLRVYGVADERCRVVHLGVGDRFFEPNVPAGSRRSRLPSDYLLHVGAMVKRKDLGTLMRAFEIVAAQHRELSLVLVGHKTRRWASDWPVVRQWLRDHKSLRSRVQILDYVPDPDVPALYAGARGIVTTSLLEGFGLTILEGLASGVPVVATRVTRRSSRSPGKLFITVRPDVPRRTPLRSIERSPITMLHGLPLGGSALAATGGLPPRSARLAPTAMRCFADNRLEPFAGREDSAGAGVPRHPKFAETALDSGTIARERTDDQLRGAANGLGDANTADHHLGRTFAVMLREEQPKTSCGLKLHRAGEISPACRPLAEVRDHRF